MFAYKKIEVKVSWNSNLSQGLGSMIQNMKHKKILKGSSYNKVALRGCKIKVKNRTVE